LGRRRHANAQKRRGLGAEALHLGIVIPLAVAVKLFVTVSVAVTACVPAVLSAIVQLGRTRRCHLCRR
jgi:hypothetical protein